MIDLTEFLLERIAEDEVRARDVAEWNPEANMGGVRIGARALAECEAKRRIIQACDYDGMTADYVLATLAEIYSDHPDYREEWRP